MTVEEKRLVSVAIWMPASSVAGHSMSWQNWMVKRYISARTDLGTDVSQEAILIARPSRRFDGGKLIRRFVGVLVSMTRH